ncbi:MAG: DUF3179 domain-containing protein [Luteitalea sp.]|nr:DUF3179 domain-containing protein [Luteitalea sp.]
MPRQIPGVVPMLDYEDAPAAIRWLERAFGFREQLRIPGAEGRIDHADLDTGHGLIMVASAPSPHYHCPRRLREVFEPARCWAAVPWVIDGVLEQTPAPESETRAGLAKEVATRRLRSHSLLFPLLVAALAAAGARGGASMTGQDDDDKLYVVVPRDAIRAIDDPEFESVEQADRRMADEETVIGLVGECEQRAYSTWQLDRHEIVNDLFEGRPLAVTW